MKSILRHFIRYPILGNAILVLVFLFGYSSYIHLQTNFFPPEPSRSIMITASYPGASPAEIEEGITLKIEDELKGLTGVERVTSTSSENLASINVELKLGYNATDMLQEVKNAIDRVTTFPVGMEQINVFKMERIDFVASMVLNGEVSLKLLKKYARRIERDLLAYPDISKISLGGFPEEEIEISVSEASLRAYKMTFDEVARAVSGANIKITGGKIKGTREEFLIRADNKGYYARDLENLVVRHSSSGSLVRLKDVARVKDKWAEDPRRDYFNGKPAVIIDVNKTNDEDMFRIADILKSYIQTFNNNHTDVQLNVVRDGSKIIQDRIDILTNNGILGMILVVLFLSLALNPRVALWVSLGIPFSFAGMFMLGPIYGLTANVMSLMAMILVIGILVDDGIVIAESIYQHYEKGEKPITAAINGTLEVLGAVISSVLTTITIFITFFFLEGGIGDHTRDIAFVVIATLSISLIEAIFILPAHIAHSKALRLKKDKHSRIEKYSESVLLWLRNKVYQPALKFVLHHTIVAIAAIIALLLITIGAVKGGIIKTTFFPNLEFDRVNITLAMPAGTPADITDSITQKIEEKIWEANAEYDAGHPDEPSLIQNVTRRIGSGTHQASIRITLSPSEERTISSAEATVYLREKIGPVKGAEKFQVGGGSRWGMPVSIALQSDNIDELRKARNDLQEQLQKIEKLKDVVNNDPPGLREVKITLKPKAWAMGLTTAQVMQQVRSGFYGKEAQRIIRGIDEIRIWVRYGLKDRMTVEQLKNMRIRLATGAQIPLSEIAELSLQRGIMSVFHIDGQRVVKVEADIANPKLSVTSILADLQEEILPDLKVKYPDVRFNFEGQSRENKKTSNAMKRVMPVILIAMFMIVVVTFRSFMQAFLVYLLIPFSLIGVAWGHYFQGYILSMLSLFGTIALIGIVVNDSLVLVSAMNQNLKANMKFKDALWEAGLSRFRPVLLTSFTTIFGLGPLMFESSFQAQFLSPMAISIAYGLLFGTILTLLILPAFLVLANQIKRFIWSKLNKKEYTAEMVEPAVREDLFVHEFEK